MEHVSVTTAGPTLAITRRIVLYKFAQRVRHQRHVQATARAAKTSCVVVWVDGAALLVPSFPATINVTNTAIA